MFNRAKNVKLLNLQSKNKQNHVFYDTFVFNKIRNIFGGKLNLIVSASAPMDK